MTRDDNFSNKSSDFFNRELKKLNSAQRKGADSIYGPVMVIAGPGTGKTQLLALRVCNIITKAQMDAHNILCLTFTDAGAVEMRSRLMRFLGQDAYNVGIYTYHSFCNQIIRENPSEFGDYKDLSNASKLEITEVVMEIIDELPLDHPMKRLKGDIYYDAKKFIALFGNMKKEGWSKDYIKTKVEEYFEGLENDPEMQFKRNTKNGAKGEVNPRLINKEKEKYENLLFAPDLIDKYNTKLNNKQRIDFNDSILWVIDRLKKNPNLLYKYQERYQFFLADEYQDTNGSQNELLFLLAENEIDDRPNLFVVGDDDQSIYRFQGANMNNIVDFKNKYNPEEVVMDQNYRSYQGILDKAMDLIAINKQRLGYQFENLTKVLKESRIQQKGIGKDPVLYKYSNQIAHDAAVIKLIDDLNKDGVPYSEIAVIYRSHKEVDNIIKYLSFHDVPLSIKRRVDVLKLNETKRILNILKYIIGEYENLYSQEALLFEILHYDFFNLSPRDIGRIAIGCSRRTDVTSDDLHWRDVLADEEALKEMKVSDPEYIVSQARILEELIHDYPNVTIQVLFEKILTSTGLLNSVLRDEDKTWRLQVINTLFNFIKEETARSPEYGLKEILVTIQKMEDFNIDLPIVKLVHSTKGVNFLTAHASKGLEFSHVIIINTTQENWVKENMNSRYDFKYPPNLISVAGESDVEDDRRLFYVAMTRAKNNLYILYPAFNATERQVNPCKFLLEMDFDVEEPFVDGKEEDVADFVATIMRYEQGRAELIDHDLIDYVLENMFMNATGITKYLKCPITFYFENILRIPMARTAPMGYGNAVHEALERTIGDLDKSPERKVPPKEKLIEYFKRGMHKFNSHFTKEEFVSYNYNGEKTLSAYYDEYSESWTLPRSFSQEYKVKAALGDIPISGVIDRMDVFDDHIDVVDYKTGKYSNGRSKLKPPLNDDPGGDYWRQVVFYKILLQQDSLQSKSVKRAIMDFVEPEKNKFNRKVYDDIGALEIDIVSEQLKEVYTNIKAHKFDEGCNDEKCKWCNFVKQNMPLQSPLTEGTESDELEV